MDKEAKIISLVGENGEEVKMELFDIATVEGVDYALLTKPEDDGEEVEVVIMRYINNGKTASFEEIEDEKELLEVTKILEKEYSDEN